MHIADILKQHYPAISFEFFPPKTEAASQDLFQTIAALKPLKPAYVSVTYGAGGSTRERTHDLVVKLQTETDLTIGCLETENVIASVFATPSPTAVIDKESICLRIGFTSVPTIEPQELIPIYSLNYSA